MAANEVDLQPVQDSVTEMEEDEIPSSDEAIPEHQLEKSGVKKDPNAPDQSGKFLKRDTVHMSLNEGGVRQKGRFTVLKSRLNSTGQYFEYQLVDGDGRAYKNGLWVREKFLRLES